MQDRDYYWEHRKWVDEREEREALRAAILREEELLNQHSTRPRKSIWGTLLIWICIGLFPIFVGVLWRIFTA